MKNTSILASVAVFLLSSCTEKNEIVGPPSGDISIMQQLVGGWKSTGERIVFHADGTFVDSGYTPSVQPDSQSSLFVVRRGKYTVTNGILYLYDRTHEFAVDTTNPGFGYSDLQYSGEIKIIGNRLIWQAVEIFSPTIEGQNDLPGTWVRTIETHHFVSPGLRYHGRMKFVYTFNPDSLQYRRSTEYVDPSPWQGTSYTSPYSYMPPLLEVSMVGQPTIWVDFNYGKMYWYHIYGAKQYLRYQ